MTVVGVVHTDLESKGGGEAVAMAVIEALQVDHDVTLMTVTDPDIDALNEYFNTDVDTEALAVRRAGWLAPILNARVGLRYHSLQNALLGRYARRRARAFDVLLSTTNELGLPAGSIEYVHVPFDWTVCLDDREDGFHPTLDGDSLYERLCTAIASVSVADIRKNTVFANSEWTANAFEEAYDVRPAVLYPPVDTSEFTDVSWEERENGFVTIGRIERSKRIAELIVLVDGLRERGHDIHLHIVGPTVDERYGRQVALLAAQRSYIRLEGELSRTELVDLVCSHRYGLHGKRDERFSIAVAELAAGGTLPFVPASGEQIAIVRDDPRLLYDSIPDAIGRIDRVLSKRTLQHELRIDPRDVRRRFGRKRFHRAIRKAVAATLDESRTVDRAPDEEVTSGGETPSVDY